MPCSTTGLTTGATAQPAPVADKAHPAGAPVPLTPAARTALIKKADAATAETADEIGLGAKEKLVVRDVVKDADGTVHTRYERTYAGLPVLGGDLVVHESKAGDDQGRHQGAPRPPSRSPTSPPTSPRPPPRSRR